MRREWHYYKKEKKEYVVSTGSKNDFWEDRGGEIVKVIDTMQRKGKQNFKQK